MLLTALTVAAVASAQNLSTEVVVDRTVTPVENLASRPFGLPPTLVLSEPEPSRLMPRNYNSLSDVTRSFAPLNPYGGTRSIEATPYRGYLSASYGPMLTTDISAGYRFHQSESLTAGISASFASEKYHSFNYPDEEANSYYDAHVRGYALWRPDSVSRLHATLSGRFLGQQTLEWESLPAQVGRLTASWTSQVGNIMAYGASADVSIDHFSEDVFTVNTHTQTAYDINAYAAYILNAGTKLGVDIDARGLKNTYISNYAVTITPYLSYKGHNISTRVGIGLEPSGYTDNNAFHVVPQFDFNAAISPAVGFYAHINGGTKLFSLNMMRAYTIYFNPILVSEPVNSYANVTAEGGFVFGPVSGLSLEVFGGYAKTKDWLTLSNFGFYYADIKGWHIGGILKYDSNLIKAHLKGDFAPRDNNKPANDQNYWAGNVDLADLKVEFALDINPIPALLAGVNYEFVHGRNYSYATWSDFEDALFDKYYQIISNLGIHAQYNVSDSFSVHGRLDNLLNRKYAITPLVAGRGINGTIGVTYKF